MKVLKEILVSVSFMVIIVLPIFDSVSNIIPSEKINENRALKTMPVFDITLLDSFPQAYDEYYTDNFELRNQFLLFNSKLKVEIFNVPPINSKAIIGSNGWMYLLKSMNDVYQGKNIVNDDKLKRYYNIFKYRKDFLDSINCKYYVVIAPTKTTVYPEFLPLSQQNTGKTSLTNQIVNLLDTVNGLTFIDLRSVLINVKDSIRLFNKTDTHWNAYGSYIAYNAIMETISIDFPKLAPVNISNFVIDSVTVKGMNLTNVLGIYHGIHETRITCDPTFEKRSKKGKMRNYPTLDWFPLKAEYEEVYSTENDSLPKMLMIRDSFARTLIPFFSEHFSESVYIFDGWHHDFNEEIVINEKPDIYIQLVMEAQIPYLYNNAKKP